MTRPTKKSTSTAETTTSRNGKAKKALPLGSVAFVGAGPGDPELLTVRAVELLAKADVVVTESQDAAFVRRFCREDVEVVDGSLGDDGQPLSHAVRARLVVKAAKAGGSGRPAARRRPVPLRHRLRGGRRLRRRPASRSRSCPASPRSAPSRRTRASR